MAIQYVNEGGKKVARDTSKPGSYQLWSEVDKERLKAEKEAAKAAKTALKNTPKAQRALDNPGTGNWSKGMVDEAISIVKGGAGNQTAAEQEAWTRAAQDSKGTFGVLGKNEHRMDDLALINKYAGYGGWAANARKAGVSEEAIQRAIATANQYYKPTTPEELEKSTTTKPGTTIPTQAERATEAADQADKLGDNVNANNTRKPYNSPVRGMAGFYTSELPGRSIPPRSPKPVTPRAGMVGGINADPAAIAANSAAVRSNPYNNKYNGAYGGYYIGTYPGIVDGLTKYGP